MNADQLMGLEEQGYSFVRTLADQPMVTNSHQSIVVDRLWQMVLVWCSCSSGISRKSPKYWQCWVDYDRIHYAFFAGAETALRELEETMLQEQREKFERFVELYSGAFYGRPGTGKTTLKVE